MARRRRKLVPWNDMTPEMRRQSSAGALCRFCVFRYSSGEPNEAAHYLYVCRHPVSRREFQLGIRCTSVVKEQGGCDLFTPIQY